MLSGIFLSAGDYRRVVIRGFIGLQRNGVSAAVQWTADITF
jgi:hypothetical protein